MPALKVIGQPVFGWVDARSNPINMPSQRFLRVRNWVPHPDGHLELRDGYSLVSGISPSPAGAGAIHSVYPFQVQTRTVDTTGVTVTVQSDSVPLMLLGNYYVVLVPLNTAGAPAGASKEFGPLVVGAGQAILFTGLLYDANTTGWRAYWGILPGGENNYASVDLTSSTPDELFIRGSLPPYPSGRPPAPKGNQVLTVLAGDHAEGAAPR